MRERYLLGDNRFAREPYKPYEMIDRVSCGPACLHIALESLGHDLSEMQLSEMVNLSDDGTEWYQMVKLPEKLGYPVIYRERASYYELAYYHDAGGSLILCWMSDNGGTLEGHYSVLDDIFVSSGNCDLIRIVDPAIGKKVSYNPDEFWKLWYDEDTVRAFMAILPKQELPNLIVP